MKRRAWAILASTASVVVVASACSDLFEDPSQCSFDRDCERFGQAICDIARKVCVPGVPGVDGGRAEDGGPIDTPDGYAPIDAKTPPSCDIDPKPVADVPGTVAQTAQGAQVDLTTSMTLDCSKDWRLVGRLVVKPGAVLTIQPGTTVLADKATNAGIVVQPGGKIIARGTADKPIVFTSAVTPRATGDWRGIHILGAAPPANQTIDGNDPALAYGGANAADDSGALEYVRIEYGGAGLVLGGVGSTTLIDNVEVRRTNDNCFMFAGGTVNAKHLVCQFPADEMFEFGSGYVGKLQFLFGHKTPAGAGHHGVLADNAFPTIYNATLCGDNVAREGMGIVFRNNARIDLADFVVQGWNTGLDAVGTLGPTVEIRNSIVAENATNPAYVEDAAQTDQNSPLFNDDNGYDEIAQFNDQNRGNKVTPAGLLECYDPAAPKPYPNAALGGARTPPNDGFFDAAATFVGAVKDPNDAWIRGKWLRFAAD